ncbi:MAG: KpsF/GutQ family sugar-phosphate isomerase [Epsilonproteobacteria bacterium]|nr:KpsF/GutQ family sugar-phosphate isomerase [Campylobacterota bacterium]
MQEDSIRAAHKTHMEEQSSGQDRIQSALMHVVTEEARALGHAVAHFPDNAHELVEKIINTTGKVIFSGNGKSGIVAQKLAATFSSLALPAVFLHPADSVHGDLGLVQQGDLFIFLSKSGTGLEFEYMLPHIKSLGVFTSMITCRHGQLKDIVDQTIMLPLQHEACSLNLAPTSSTTLMSAFGDALAVVASQAKNIGKDDFVRLHPAGALGKQLLCSVESFLHEGLELPTVSEHASFQDVLTAITQRRLGIVIVLDRAEQMCGIITDGDVRRACALGAHVFDKTAVELMTRNPKTVQVGALASTALQIMEDYNITTLLVMDGNQLRGVVHIHDLVKAGISS